MFIKIANFKKRVFKIIPGPESSGWECARAAGQYVEHKEVDTHIFWPPHSDTCDCLAIPGEADVTYYEGEFFPVIKFKACDE